MVLGMASGTVLQALASALLGESVHEVMHRLRDEGFSWQRIADKLANDTNGVLVLSRETYRLWYENELKDTTP
jgi:intein-encoded DNA endonuclease-like protein